MKKTGILLVTAIILCLMFTNLSGAITTTQKALVINANQQTIIDVLEEFIIVNNYTIKFSDHARGLVQIFVKETVDSGNVIANKDTFIYNPPTVTDWYFSVKVSQKDNNVLISGTSTGGFFPGKYFKQFTQYLQNNGYQIIFGEKDVNAYLASPAPPTVQQLPATTNTQPAQ